MDVRDELAELLAAKGLPPKQLRHLRTRGSSDVWSAMLAGPMGDAELEILVYALGDHPERFSDFEDEKAALREFRALARPGGEEVVFEGRDERLGVIVT